MTPHGQTRRPEIN